MTSSSNTIQASKKQAGNDLLKKLTRCPYTLVDIEPDFIVGRTACVLYLSVRFHALHPNYIYERVNRLGDNFELRVLLVNIDHVEHKSYLMELTKLSIRSNLTLMLSWTIEDAAMILEKLKLNEDKPPDGIMERPTSEEYGDALDQYVIDAIAENRYITRVDAAFLVSLFGSFEHLVAATPEDYSLCYGVGFQKGQKLYDLLHRPMKRGFEARSSGSGNSSGGGQGGSSFNGGSASSIATGNGAGHVVLETCESAERTTTLTENASCTFASEED